MGENVNVKNSTFNEYGSMDVSRSTSTACCSYPDDGVDDGDGVDDVDDDDDDDSSSSLSSDSSTFSFIKLTRQQKGLLMSICLTEFTIMCCSSLISPLLPPEATGRNISGQLQGWIMASFAGGQFVIFPVFGKYISKVGLKFMYLAGIFIAGGCTVLMGSLQFVPHEEGSTIFVSVCFVLQVAMSVGVTAEQTSAFTLASKEFSGYFTTVFGITEVFVGLGLTVGPLVGGVLSDIGGFSLPFFVLGSLVLSSLVCNYCLAPSIVDEQPVGKLRRKSGLGLLRHPSIIITCLAVICGSGVWSVLDPILEPHLAGFNLSPSLVGAVFLLLSASYALSCAFCGWIAEKLPDNRLLMIPGFLLCGVAHCLLAPSPLFGFEASYGELWLIIIALILLGFAMSMAIIPSYDIIMEIAIESGYPDNLSTHGLVAGLWSSMYALGDFIGPIWGGYIQDNIGFAWGLTYTAGACVVIVVLLTGIALYDCYCCEVEDDESEISEKTRLLPTEVVQRQRLISEPVVRGRRMAPVLESVHYFEHSDNLMSGFSSIGPPGNGTHINISTTRSHGSYTYYSHPGSHSSHGIQDGVCSGISSNKKSIQYGCHGISTSPEKHQKLQNGMNETYPLLSEYQIKSLHIPHTLPSGDRPTTSKSSPTREDNSKYKTYLQSDPPGGAAIEYQQSRSLPINLPENNYFCCATNSRLSASYPDEASWNNPRLITIDVDSPETRCNKDGAIPRISDNDEKHITGELHISFFKGRQLNRSMSSPSEDVVKIINYQSNIAIGSRNPPNSIIETLDSVNEVTHNVNIYPKIIICQPVNYHDNRTTSSSDQSSIDSDEKQTQTEIQKLYKSPKIKFHRPKYLKRSKSMYQSTKLTKLATIIPSNGIRSPLFTTFIMAYNSGLEQRPHRQRSLSNPDLNTSKRSTCDKKTNRSTCEKKTNRSTCDKKANRSTCEKKTNTSVNTADDTYDQVFGSAEYPDVFNNNNLLPFMDVQQGALF